MHLPEHPVTLTPERIAELNNELSKMRHDINNNLSVMVAALELIRLNPENADRMLGNINQQFGRIGENLGKFSAEFEKSLGITRP